MKKLLLLFVIILVSLFIKPIPVLAFDFKSGENIDVAKDTLINGTLVVTGKTLTIDGSIDGDLICVGQTVKIKAAVTGDILCAGQTVSVSGPVEGNLRIAGQNISISNNVKRNTSVFGQHITFSKESNVAMDTLLFGQQLEENGTVGRDLISAGQNLQVNGQIGRDVIFNGEQLNLGSSANIFGNVNYTGKQKVLIDPKATISGSLHEFKPVQPAKSVKPAKVNTPVFRSIKLAGLLVYLAIGLIFLAFFPKFIEKTTQSVREIPFVLLATGLITIAVIPIILIFLILTILGIPLAIAGGILFGILLWLSKIIPSIAMGQILIEKIYGKKSTVSPILIGALGLILSYIVFNLPIIGWLASFLALFIGLGAFTHLLFYRKSK